MSIDVAAELTELAARVRGEGEWPKFTMNSEAVFEYSSPSCYREFPFNTRVWRKFLDWGGNVYMNSSAETPITPAEAARLTGGGVDESEDTELRDDFALQAMGAIGSCDTRSEAHHNYDVWAESCYKFADAMMKARR